jgi:hypothetical protein
MANEGNRGAGDKEKTEKIGRTSEEDVTNESNDDFDEDDDLDSEDEESEKE